MLKEIRKIIDDVILKMNIEGEFKYSIEQAPALIETDIATNVALVLSKKIKKNPKEVSDVIIENIRKNQIISEVQFQSGFINIKLTDDFIFDKLKSAISSDSSYGRTKLLNGKKILIEFISANPTGPLHIGHGRGAAYGDSLARLFEFSDGCVEREYYINDVGNQMEVLTNSVVSYILKKPLAENGYKGKYIEDIAKQIVDNKIPDVEYKAYTINKILEWIKTDLEKFGVKFNNWFKESSLYEKNEVSLIIEKLKKNGFAYEKDDAVWFKSTAFSDDKDRVLVRADGRTTYIASDIAYHYNKYQRKFDEYINIWGADHHGYVERMRGSIKAIGEDEKKLKIILYQLVNIVKDGKKITMSTRENKFTTLDEVLGEVGVDATRFFLLMRSSESHLDFDLDLAKKQAPENPVFYVQYAHARICSIFKEAKKMNCEFLVDTYDLQVLKLKEEKGLVKSVLFFEDIIEIAVRDCAPHYITKYLQDISADFHSYYNKNRVITENSKLTIARLQMCQAVKNVIKNGLYLLGVSAPERM
ncbi:MAG: arginine--tRNA ligase [Elusimicrobia bacterium]|nr:arginine--tRNA ligase [Elusimicrobiota bacterium]